MIDFSVHKGVLSVMYGIDLGSILIRFRAQYPRAL